MRSGLLLTLVLALAGKADAHAQAREVAPREAAERVHEEGRYPSDVTPLIPDRSMGTGTGSGDDEEGRGRGARGETVLGDRDSGDRGTGDDSGLGGAVRQILEWIEGLRDAVGGPVAWVLLVVGLALVALLVAYLVVRVRLGRDAKTIEARATSAEGEIDPLLVGPSASADELALQARWGEAIHAIFLDALGRVGGRDGRHRGRTARELVTRSAREELVDLLELTELVWFGGRPATEEQYHRARELAAKVPAQAKGADHEEAA